MQIVRFRLWHKKVGTTSLEEIFKNPYKSLSEHSPVLKISSICLPTPSFHLLWTKKGFREVVDTEGPVLEPLVSGHEWIVSGTLPFSVINRKRLSLLREALFKEAALKLLQPAPLCLAVLGRRYFIVARPWWVLEEASSAQPFWA